MDNQVNKGFTLIELLVTMSIMAILLAIAVPSYQSVTTGMRMSSEINALSADISFARSEAIKQGLNVNVCSSSNASTCNSGSNISWATGWIVSNSVTVKLLHISSGVSHGDTLNGASPIIFTPAGYTQYTGTLTLHDSNDDQNQRRCLVFATGTWTLLTGATCP